MEWKGLDFISVCFGLAKKAAWWFHSSLTLCACYRRRAVATRTHQVKNTPITVDDRESTPREKKGISTTTTY